jgi:hypothetical protein
MLSETKPRVVVAGDVYIDWLSVPAAPAAKGTASPPLRNWQLKDGRNMYPRRGGAWLTADLVEAAVKVAVGDRAIVIKPSVPGDLNSIPPEDVIHSMLALDTFKRDWRGKVVEVWGVRKFEGFAGPADGSPRNPPAPDPDTATADVVVLDDAGNGFRDVQSQGTWPKALLEGKLPIVVYKVRRPLQDGDLWERLEASHLDRTIAILDVDDLRAAGASISRHLSWERTAAECAMSLCYDDAYQRLAECRHLIVTLGLEGALHIRKPDGLGRPRLVDASGVDREKGRYQASLWYVPDLIEGDLQHGHRRGKMSGLHSAFVAAVTASVVEKIVAVAAEASQSTEGEKAVAGDTEAPRPTEEMVGEGVHKGIVAARRLLELAFGRIKTGTKASALAQTAFTHPTRGLFGKPPLAEFRVERVDLPPILIPPQPKQMSRLRYWRIIDSMRRVPMRELAEKVALEGLGRALPEIPVARFGKLETIDRWEIEGYRSIRNMLREYLRNPRRDHPLCIAVFGRPGSGKSFGVTEVARSVADGDQIELSVFNLSQWKSVEDLAVALHRVRDSGLRGKVPLVFFDEFDSKLDGQELGWLKYFLAPMNDGVFSDGQFTHLIGPAIFVFAGGTCSAFQEFRTKSLGESNAERKVPDFLSRLRGTVDVVGPDPLTDTRKISRAMILRWALKKRSKQLFDAEETLKIDRNLLAAFLNVMEFRHGARSIEAIVEMSQLEGCERFVPSFLPPPPQLRLHVDPQEFLGILKQWPRFEPHIEPIARSLHERFVHDELKGETDPVKVAEIRRKPGRQVWEDLDEIYCESNRDQAAHILTKLAVVGCDLEPKPDEESVGAFKFTEDEVQLLAQMEHERWMAERRTKEPDHPDLKPWVDLPEEEKEKDIQHIRSLSEILRGEKLQIVRR